MISADGTDYSQKYNIQLYHFQILPSPTAHRCLTYREYPVEMAYNPGIVELDMDSHPVPFSMCHQNQNFDRYSAVSFHWHCIFLHS